MRIVLGLGNPGRRYARTRHNVGFRVVDRLAEECGAATGAGPVGEVAETVRVRLVHEEVLLAKPMTWMNRSGAAAARLAAMYGTLPEGFLVVYDDVALPLGTLRLRPSGRSAGQKGMESVIRALGTEEVPRLRLGILGERAGADLADYVLEPFLPEELEAADAMVVRASKAVRTALDSGLQDAMNLFNRREAAPG